MARVTVEDCVLRVSNRFKLVMLASQRARAVSSGAPITVDRDNDKNPVIALREIEVKEGPGQVIDLSLLEPIFSVLGPEALSFKVTGRPKERAGSGSMKSEMS